MDDPTRQRIEQRIAELEEQRLQRVQVIAAMDGGIRELKKLLEPIAPEPPQPEPEAQP